MGTETAIIDGSKRAHKVIDDLENALSEAEKNAKETAANAGEQAEVLVGEAQEKVTESLQTIEKFVKEKPVQAVGIAFAAGIVTAAILRRR